jgi:hypothetical protein
MAEEGQVAETTQVLEGKSELAMVVERELVTNFREMVMAGRAPTSGSEYVWNSEGTRVDKITQVEERPAAMWGSGRLGNVRELDNGYG